MLQNCDWQHALEDGGIGGLIGAVIVWFWNWYRLRGTVTKKSAYEK